MTEKENITYMRLNKLRLYFNTASQARTEQECGILLLWENMTRDNTF